MGPQTPSNQRFTSHVDTLMLSVQYLTENGSQIAGSVEYSNYLEWLLVGIVNDQVVQVRLYNPESNWQSSQVRPRSSSKG